MRTAWKITIGLAGAIAAAGVALAGDGAATAPAYEAWVGTWSGTVSYKGCAETGKAPVDLEIGLAPDGALRSNGDVLVDGLGDLDWTAASKKKLSAAREGLAGSVTLGKGKLTLAVKTSGGCSIKGTLKRAGSGIPACDEVRALATAKAQCQALPSESRGEALAEVEAAWDEWRAARGKAKKAQAKACTARRDVLRDEVAACGGGGAFSTGIPGCDRYIAMMERYLACDKVPQAARDGARQGMDAMKQAWGDMKTMPAEAVKAANDACEQAVDALRQSASAMGCSL